MSSKEGHSSNTKPISEEEQGRRLEDSEREAAKGGAQNYQEDARDAKAVSTGQKDPKDVGSIERLDNDGAPKAGQGD